jgi:hypothetical protein
MESKEKEPAKLEEGLDYYFENGLMVLTAHFLLNRGYCCGNGCRHCPYGEEEQTLPGNQSR